MKRQQNPALDDESLRHYLGSGLLTILAKTPLKIGRDTFTMRQLARDLGVTNAKAAGILSKAAEDIGARDTRDFYARSSPYALARLNGIGKFTVYVALRLFEAQGLDSHAWFGQRPEGETMATFDTIKRREYAAEARTKNGSSRRKRGTR